MREIQQDEYVEAVKEGFTLVDVYGDTCQPCKVLHQTLEILEKEYPFVNIVRINADHNPAFCDEHQIMGVPTIFFVVDGEIKDRQLGALSVEEIMEIAGEYLY